ncbi:Glycosyltransferase involved in cell wall bisynthesis [Butyrivibrio sp. ob235]|uniref:glycosyltransferase family 2 protein n=1 Tax=Butyrivibrio sp. ob235 TaxID=1761780 RepID=UPI0008B687A7|nr:glycosyltransferase [Butyrivibrio sp. ob235]SEL72786.1 Glycosyltransferase involved in cell wall bisynthesis [Butyrivibrio sp. ob235]
MVSIIMPVFNAQMYMRETIDSVLAQSYSDLELIIVNDGSTDESLSIALEYEAIDSRVKVITQTNMGVSCARNIGVGEAKGEYIVFIDADDLLAEDMIELLFSTANNNKADVVSCGAGVISDGKLIREEFGTNRFVKFNHREALEFFLKGKKVNIGVWSKIFSRDIAKQIQFREGIRINEDKLYIFDALMISNTFILNDVTKYYYMKREGSATTRKFDERWFDSLLVADEIRRRIDTEQRELNVFARVNMVKAYYWVLLLFYKNPWAIKQYNDKYREVISVIKKNTSIDIYRYLTRNMIINISLLKLSAVLLERIKVKR